MRPMSSETWVLSKYEDASEFIKLTLQLRQGSNSGFGDLEDEFEVHLTINILNRSFSRSVMSNLHNISAFSFLCSYKLKII